MKVSTNLLVFLAAASAVNAAPPKMDIYHVYNPKATSAQEAALEQFASKLKDLGMTINRKEPDGECDYIRNDTHGCPHTWQWPTKRLLVRLPNEQTLDMLANCRDEFGSETMDKTPGAMTACMKLFTNVFAQMETRKMEWMLWHEECGWKAPDYGLNSACFVVDPMWVI